ncbi:MAG: YeeE/YedE family protein, partial [Hyphomicrobiales bacterium]
GLAGGVLIGLSAVLLMAAYGRVAGLSGIFGGLLTQHLGGEFSWRAAFIAGLLIGAAAAAQAGLFEAASIAFSGGPALTAAGGLIVGFGTALGAGCTSGHGICGISRLSRRSIAATVIFMAVAIATVMITRHAMAG